MKATVITKQRSGLIIEMERLLVLWLEDQNQRRIPVSLMVIQEKAKRLFEELKKKRGKEVLVKSLMLVGVGLCNLRLEPITLTLKFKVKLLVEMKKQPVNFLQRWLRLLGREAILLSKCSMWMRPVYSGSACLTAHTLLRRRSQHLVTKQARRGWLCCLEGMLLATSN